jgi:hypothetical protein
VFAAPAAPLAVVAELKRNENNPRKPEAHAADGSQALISAKWEHLTTEDKDLAVNREKCASFSSTEKPSKHQTAGLSAATSGKLLQIQRHAMLAADAGRWRLRQGLSWTDV